MGKGKIEYAGQTFEGRDLLSCSCVLENSLTAEGLSVDTLEFEVRSGDETLMQFTRNAPLKFYFDNVLTGQFYVSNVARTGRYSYLFTATSAVGLLDQVTHYGGMYTGQSAKDLIDEIIGDIPHTTDQFLAMERVYGWLPIASRRDNLRQVLFAVGAAVKKAADGTLDVVFPDGELAGTITADQMFENPSMETETAATAVQVTEHAYVTGGESVTLFEGFTEQGDIIKFDEPVYNLAATGVTILESNCNYAKVSAGSCTLTGNKYYHTTRVITQAASSARGQDADNVISVEDATLVSLVNSANVAKRVIAYYEIGQKIKADIVTEGRKPGEVIGMPHPFGGTVEACIESLDISVSSFMRASMAAVPGFVPTNGGNNYRNRAVLTESGTWTVPDGVTSVRAIPIGGGQGGSSGAAGGDGIAPTYVVPVPLMYAYPWGLSGAGGRGGNGGSGGKIYEGTLSVTPGQVINVTVGGGGAGGVPGNLVSGSIGEDSIFGELSSSMGDVSDTGYIDIISGLIYARKSTVSGIDGGRGTGTLEDSASSTVVTGDVVQGATPGTSGQASDYYQSSYGTAHAEGGCGGGAALGANGGSGSNGNSYRTGDHVYAYGGRGGDGATPTVTPSAAVTPGDGGAGGHGGGGAGGSGVCSVKVASNHVAGAPMLPGMAKGGNGGRGGDGAPGCIIIYY